MGIEVRKDCEYFSPKRFEYDTEDCQTDGHYLCSGCRRIAPFQSMELSDNRMRFYEKKELERIEKDEDYTIY